MYQAIIFDLDNTLLDYSSSELDCMKRTLREHQFSVDNEEKWEAFWKAYTQHNFKHWMDFVNKCGPHQCIEDVLISSFRDSLNMEPSYHETLSNTYWDHFCNTCIFEEGAEDLLLSMNSQYQLGIISNGIGKAQRMRLSAGKINHYFASIVVSDEAGIRKPDKGIFDLSLNELGVSGNEVLFIGDSLTDDYAGASNAGIDFCFYNRKGIEVPDGVQPKFMVRKLEELRKII